MFSRERLIVSIWGNGAEIDARTVDAHIGRLRKALIGKREQDPIRTVRNVSYALDETLAAPKGVRLQKTPQSSRTQRSSSRWVTPEIKLAKEFPRKVIFGANRASGSAQI